MQLFAGLNRNVLILSLCQASMFSGQSLIVATSALVGFALADDKSLATLPFASQLLTTMLTSIPAAALMARIGRAGAFRLATLLGMTGGGLCTAAIMQGSFSMFLAGSVFLGAFAGFGNYYRFAAADSVESGNKSRAISYVMAGGVVAAFVGPNLANATQNLLGSAAFAGSYASLIGLHVLALGLLVFFRPPRVKSRAEREAEGSGRPLREIAAQPRFVVAVLCGALGYAVMTFVMTATPLAMQHEGHLFSDSSFVIQWHVLGMFAPSFFTGQIIGRVGLLRTMSIGAAAGLLCIAVNLTGQTVWHFWAALTLLGIAWNFLFIGATTLLTRAYRSEETFKTQAANDFIVFSTVTAASLSAGAIHHHFGWQVINYGAIPALVVVLVALGWLAWWERGGTASGSRALGSAAEAAE
ncbi:MAG TPA: MFS transporter [Arenicellales bacterium]|nr:MFS transporter [Arenicellales bacterium]